MKRFYLLGLFLTMLLGVSFSASAATATFKWTTAGSVQIRTGSTSGDFVVLPDDATEYTFDTSPNSFGYVYLYAADGYIINSVKTEDGSRTFYYSSYTKAYSCTINSSLNGQTIIVESVPLVREDDLNINIVNGANFIKATFESGYTLDLQNGNHTYKFNPSIDKQLTLELNGLDALYSITYNGEPVAKNQYWAEYYITPEANSTIDIQATEGAGPKECKVTINAEDLGCIKTIRNYTASSWVYDGESTLENPFTVLENNEIYVNLNTEDYKEYTVTFNDEPVTLTNGGARAVIKPTEEENTLSINCTKIDWGYTTFTGYITNYDGVEFSALYDGEALEPVSVTDAASDVNVDGFNFPASDTKVVKYQVSAKRGIIFFRPKDGWYISKVFDSYKDEQGGSASLNESLEGTTFYMAAQKLPEAYTANLTVIGNQVYTKISPSKTLANRWDNPTALDYSAAPGTREISFLPGYNTPIVIGMDGEKTSAVYLDGGSVSGSVNPDSNIMEYFVTPYAPESETDSKELHSDITVISDETTGNTTGASLKLENDATAEFFYSDFRHPADPTAQTVLAGTKMGVKPASADSYIIFKGQVVNGIAADGTRVNGLDENGIYWFTPAGGARNNTVTVGNYTEADIKVSPANGETVKTLTKISVTLPVIDDNYEKMLDLADTANPGITVTKDGQSVSALEIGDPGESDEGMVVNFLLDTPATEAGEYTITVPAGAFVEKTYDETADAMVAVAGGRISKAYTGTVTVDPTMVSVCDKYILNPADGETVEQLSVITVTFTELLPSDYFSGYEFQNATLTNGTTTYNAAVSYNWGNETENQQMNVTLIDANEEAIVVNEAGEWTLTIAANTFDFNGETNSEITATYTVAPAEAYTIVPADGATTGNLSVIKVTFNKAETVEEVAGKNITLTGANGYNQKALEYTAFQNVATIRFANPLTDGKYTLTIPAGTFTLDGTDSEEITATYTYEAVWTLTPEPGEEVESLSEFILTFPKATDVEFVGNRFSFSLLNSTETYAAPGFDATKVETASVPTFVLSLIKGAQQPPVGSYTFIIDEAAFTLDGEDSPEIRVNYSLMKEASADYQVSPANGIVVAEVYGYYVSFLFDETSNITYNSEDYSKIHVYFDETELIANRDYACISEGNMAHFNVFNTDYCKAGTFRVNLEAGAFKLGNTDSPAADETWTVIEPRDYNYTISPSTDEILVTLTKFTITFPEAKKVEMWDYTTNYIELKLNAQVTGAELTTTVVEGAEVPTVEIAVTNAPETAGELKLNVGYGAFVLDGGLYSPAIEATYEYDPKSGIEGITFDVTNGVTVYTVNGIMLMKDAPATELKNLENGLYIINGVKVMIRK